MSWVEIIVPVGPDSDVEEIAALMVAHVPAAAAGTEVRGDEVVFWAQLDEQEQALAQAKAQVAEWQQNGADVDPGSVRAAPAMPEQEWRDAWKRYFKVSHLTKQFVVVPSWESYTPAAGELVIDLDPGMAFGTGTHASTQLVLEAIQRLADDNVTPTRILDVGAGSGILAIAAAKRWPSAHCIAIDNDPIAVQACAENAALNKVGDRIESALTPVEQITGEFPLVLANIQAHILRVMRHDLVARTAPGGTLLLSGILTPQAEPLAAEFVAAGMTLVGMFAGSDAAWTGITLAKASPVQA